MPLLFGWMEPYAAGYFGANANQRIACALAGDAVLILSVFVLGGNFWDKVRSLFVHDATAQFPVASADG